MPSFQHGGARGIQYLLSCRFYNDLLRPFFRKTIPNRPLDDRQSLESITGDQQKITYGFTEALRQLAPDTGAYLNEVCATYYIAHKTRPDYSTIFFTFLFRHRQLSQTSKMPSTETTILDFLLSRISMIQTRSCMDLHALVGTDGRR